MGNKKSENVAVRSEKKIKKGKPITLLSILCFVMVFLLVFTFLRFPIGIKNYNSVVGAIDLDYDIEGGIAYTLTLSDENVEEVEDVDEVVETLRYRMRELGYQVFNVKAINSTEVGVEDYEIRIECKSTETNASDINVVAAYGAISVLGGSATSGNPEILADIDVVEDAEYLGSPTDGTKMNYYVSVTLTDEAYEQIIEYIDEAASAENSSSTSYYLGVKLGEQTLLQESAITKDSFSDKSLVFTSASESSAKQIALQMKSGGLAYQYDVSEGIAIDSPYGDKVALKCLIVILALLLASIVLFAVAHKGFGIVLSLSLIAGAILQTLMLIAVPGITLSISGVVGFGLALVLTAFSLMLTGNSIKTEFKYTQKTVKAAVKKGFKDMVMPIVNLFVVSAVVAGALLIFTTGALNCFAVTFGIGVIIGAIVSLVFSRMFSALILPIAEFSEKFK